MIAGIVVAGFGLASVYIAPTSQYLLNTFGISKTMMILAVFFFIAVALFSQLLTNPPAGYVPSVTPNMAQAAKAPARDVNWKVMLSTGQFWVLWLMFFLASGVGLVLIGSATEFVPKLKGAGFIVVVFLAIGNASGRVLAGMISDRIGRQTTLCTVFLLQATMVLLLLFIDDPIAMVLGIFLLAGANYGANLALFPAASKDYFGLKAFGLNYGLLFTAWGIGGFVLSQVKGYLKDHFTGPSLTGTSMTAGFQYALILAAVLMVVAAALTLVSSRLAKRTAG